MTNAASRTGGMGLDDVTATAIYGLYTAGGVCRRAARRLDCRSTARSAAVGVLGRRRHRRRSFHARDSVNIVAFYLGLTLIVVGTGLLKPNVSAIVGDLYPEGGARRDAGFSIYYMGINIGGFLGPLICGYLGETVDWHLGFGAAGVGMVLGLIQYSLGGRHLGTAGELRPESQSPAARARPARSLLRAVGSDRRSRADRLGAAGDGRVQADARRLR